MKQHELLRHVGERLFGGQWQGQVCAIIGVSDRSLRRWLSGAEPIPSGVWSDILRVIQSQWVDLRELEYQVRDLHRVAVYSFQVYDAMKGEYAKQAASKRTADDIQRIGGKIIPGTQQIVDSRALDEQGRYMPPADGAEWSVGNVQSTTEGYGFNILNKFRAPVASFSYPDMALAQSSHDLMAAALGDATLVLGHSG
jgi:hypothetical protein